MKAILFDLDGVLVSAKEIHYKALNEALSKIDEKYVISENEHLSIFDGLKTNEKLHLLTKLKNLPESYHKQVWNLKQQITLEKINDLKFDMNLIHVFEELSKLNIKIACCSNSIRKSVINMLTNIGIVKYFDLILSNEDVKNSKPHPEIYWKAMSLFSLNPEDCLIVEDSPHGLLAAQRSNCKILRVKNPQEINFEKIQSYLNIQQTMKTKWQDKSMNVLIPMAGAGSRFE